MLFYFIRGWGFKPAPRKDTRAMKKCGKAEQKHMAKPAFS
jgi:hypothetical protein